MKIFNTFFILFAGLTFQACSSHPGNTSKNPQHTKDTAAVAMESFSAGQVIDKVICKSDTSQSFAMYLPKGYDIKKIYPVIYAFDAHGTGKLPVADYKDLAEKYGYIIVGSNNSQNGTSWEQSQAIAATLFSDTKSRLAIDEHRVYLMGFSGGARVANALAITNGYVAGVICCGAANPAVNSINPRNNYTFFGIAGDADFNYTEMRKYDLVDLAGHDVKHAVISFEGKHEWPPVPTMEEAFVWEELDNMRKNPATKNTAMIQSGIKTETDKLNALLKQNKEYEAYELCRKDLNFYEKLDNLTLFYDTYKKLKTSEAVDHQLKLNEAAWNREEKMKGGYMDALQTQNYEWWVKDIASVNQKIKTGKDKEEVAIEERILSYLSLVCYMQTSGTLKQNNVIAAEYYCKLYKLVDPKNTEADYLMAEIKAKQADNEAAIKALNESVKNGFTDVKRLESDSAFNTLKSDPQFIKVKESIRK
ncbi:MAG: hypothetical protein JWP12_3327 [Bacteroidetes bacterium]|nr:hypothetical protein [Bacteroidota bacterium]